MSVTRLFTLGVPVDRAEIFLEIFVISSVVTVGVPLGTDTFVSAYVAAKYQEISHYIDKLDPLTDGFIHYQLVRFCQSICLRYLNAHIPKSYRSDLITAGAS